MISTSDLTPKLLNINQLFGEPNTTYTIPIYQRNFAWQAAQIEQLISDIKDAAHEDKDGSYFLGNLVVTPRKGKKIDYEVIDGQQRLTTLYLLLTSLAGASSAFTSYQERLLYESRPRATEALRRVATHALKGPVSSFSLTSDEDAGIHAGFNVIQQYLKQNFSEDNNRSQFANFLGNRVTVVRASLPTETDLNRYFEIMNTRGQQLQQVDIVKARLMSRLAGEEERACFAWVWDACVDMDSYVQMSLTRGKPKLREKLFGESWSWLCIKSFNGLMHCMTDQKAVGGAKAANGSLSIDQAIEKYIATNNLSNTDEDIDNVRFRSTIDFPAFLLHVLKIFKGDAAKDGQLDENEGQLDDKRLVKQFDEHFSKSPPEQICDFAFKLLLCRNLFDGFILKRQYTTTHVDDGDWSLQRLVKSKTQATSSYVNTFSRDRCEDEEVNTNDQTKKELLLIQSMLRVTFTSARTMHWVTMLLKHVEKQDPGTVDEASLVELLRDHARSKVKVFFDDGELVGFSINRIVFTYLDYLLLTLNQKNSDFRFSFRNSIEHFYPQHPDEQQSGISISEKCLPLLGNLALVSVGANSKFSNSLPKAKAENYKTTIEMQSPKLHKMAEITRQKGWGEVQILEHHNAMIHLLKEDVCLAKSRN